MANLDTPEGRLAAAEALGPKGYNAAMKAHQDRNTIETINGHAIRAVSSRFGRLFAVGNTGRAFSTADQARAFATDN